jgi:hypothetical protein
MENTTCLQYCINGMNDKLLEYASAKEGRALIETFKAYTANRDIQIQELIVSHNSYYMVLAAIQVHGLPKTEQSVRDFIGGYEFKHLHDEIVKTVQKNYSMLVSRLSRKQKQELEALFA